MFIGMKDWDSLVDPWHENVHWHKRPRPPCRSLTWKCLLAWKSETPLSIPDMKMFIGMKYWDPLVDPWHENVHWHERPRPPSRSQTWKCLLAWKTETLLSIPDIKIFIGMKYWDPLVDPWHENVHWHERSSPPNRSLTWKCLLAWKIESPLSIPDMKMFIGMKDWVPLVDPWYEIFISMQNRAPLGNPCCKQKNNKQAGPRTLKYNSGKFVDFVLILKNYIWIEGGGLPYSSHVESSVLCHEEPWLATTSSLWYTNSIRGTGL